MIKEIPNRFILPLIAASSVIRKEKIFIHLLIRAKEKRISARKIYEVLLQSYLFAGFPSALIALKTFSKIFPAFRTNKEILLYSILKKRGEKTCKKIYGDKFNKLIENVNSFSPDLAEYIIIEGYGKILSRNQLSLKERELAIISVLSVLKYEEQLYSHINGAYRLGIKIPVVCELIDSLRILGNGTYSAFGKKILDRFNK
ncbi:MAG: hypothetical protein EHM47_14745 [Ignavibacteriales bacterium]|nr:MAG: hypothetical protein EHM47_14745 [Ignavibacteriales bacterium]